MARGPAIHAASALLLRARLTFDASISAHDLTARLAALLSRQGETARLRGHEVFRVTFYRGFNTLGAVVQASVRPGPTGSQVQMVVRPELLPALVLVPALALAVFREAWWVALCVGTFTYALYTLSFWASMVAIRRILVERGSPADRAHPPDASGVASLEGADAGTRSARPAP